MVRKTPVVAGVFFIVLGYSVIMSDKNGSNSDKRRESDDDKVIRFPTLAQRDRMRREEREQQKRWQKEYQAQRKAQARSNNPPFFNTGNLPVVTKYMALAFVMIHIVMVWGVDESMRMSVIQSFGFVAANYIQGSAPFWQLLVSPFSYAFLHGDWMHIGFNVVMLLALGAMFERIIGARLFLLVFFACSLSGALLSFVLASDSAIPIVGAAGGLSGLFAGMIIVFHARGIYGPISPKLARYGVLPLLGFWLGVMILMGLLMGGIAWQAHVGGFLCGVVLMMFARRGGVIL